MPSPKCSCTWLISSPEHSSRIDALSPTLRSSVAPPHNILKVHILQNSSRNRTASQIKRTSNTADCPLAAAPQHFSAS